MTITPSIAADLIQNALFAALRDDEVEFSCDGEILVRVGGRPFAPTVERIMRGANRVLNNRLPGVRGARVEDALLGEEQVSSIALGFLLAGMRRDDAAAQVLSGLFE